MTNQTERDAFEANIKELFRCDEGTFNRTSQGLYYNRVHDLYQQTCWSEVQHLWRLWIHKTAYARQDERAKVIEECAKVCEHYPIYNEFQDVNQFDCAEAIRALQSKGE